MAARQLIGACALLLMVSRTRPATDASRIVRAADCRGRHPSARDRVHDRRVGTPCCQGQARRAPSRQPRADAGVPKNPDDGSGRQRDSAWRFATKRPVAPPRCRGCRGVDRTHLFCDLPDDECAAIVFAAIGLPSIAAGTVAGTLVDAAIKKTVFQFAGTRGSARSNVARSRRPAGWSARDDSVLTAPSRR